MGEFGETKGGVGNKWHAGEWPLLPRDWGFATYLPPLISGTGKATDFKFGRYIYRAIPKKPLKILEKRERERIQGLPTFLGTPYYHRSG